jgi:predicted ATPase
MKPCTCRAPHPRKRIVLTGGPGAGKTAVLELVRQLFCEHVVVLPEAASILFSGGFPRGGGAQSRAVQRAIFHVQRELERGVEESGAPAIVLCDRGTPDGGAYWVGPGDLWSEVGTTREREIARYDAVIHLRTPGADEGYNQRNPVRVESAAEAALVDERIAEVWRGHARRYVVESTSEFLQKAHRAVAILRRELPECCRAHLVDLGPTEPEAAPH